MSKIYVYKITNKLNSKYYIGVHKHTKGIDNYMGSGKAIKSAIKKYGKENFFKEILREFETYDAAFSYEKELVTQKEVDNQMCYNIMFGGKGGWDTASKHNIGSKHTNETKSLMSMCASGSNNSQYNKPVAQEHRDKISKANKGRVSHRKGKSLPDSTKLKIKNQKRYTCEHCGISATKGNINRWHGDKCKSFISKQL